MRISDWSSDVCSSDLILPHHSQPTIAAEPIALPMTASRPDFIIADQPAKPAPKSSARTLKGLVADLSTPTTRDAAHDCLAATIYHESRAEPLEGQLAVAEVVIHRKIGRASGKERGCQSG